MIRIQMTNARPTKVPTISIQMIRLPLSRTNLSHIQSPTSERNLHLSTPDRSNSPLQWLNYQHPDSPTPKSSQLRLRHYSNNQTPNYLLSNRRNPNYQVPITNTRATRIKLPIAGEPEPPASAPQLGNIHFTARQYPLECPGAIPSK